MREDSLHKKLEEILGPNGAGSGADWLNERGWEGPLPKAIASPATREQVCEVLRLASTERLKVAPAGGGTKQRLGGIPQGIDLLLSLARLNCVTDYPASDLTISVEAGLPLRELAATLAAQGQMLPLDMPFAGQATIGGAFATNSSGPRRLGYGTWRDMVLGVHFVTAAGKLAKSGGKVVKNVAGYDLSRLLIGSFGTLGVIVEIAFKVFPAPPASATFVLGFATLEGALQAIQRIRNSPLNPQALDLMNSTAGLLESAPETTAAEKLFVGVAGPPVVVERFQRELPPLVRACGLESVLEYKNAQEAKLWQSIQELTPSFLQSQPEGVVVKASLLLNQMGNFLNTVRETASAHGLSHATLTRAGAGIVYCYLWPASEQGSAAPAERLAQTSKGLIQEANQHGGRALVEWCPTALKSKIPLMWGPLRDDFPWMQRLKTEMDPLGILNPGRFYGGI